MTRTPGSRGVYPPDPRYDVANTLREHGFQLTMGVVDPYDKEEALDAPTGLTLTFNVREKKTHLEWHAIVSCNASTPNACAADISTYIFQLRPCKANGDPIDNNVLADLNNEDYKWQHSVTRKEAGDMSKPHAVFDVANPRSWYYQCRARIRDNAGRLSAFTAWSSPELPVSQSEPVVSSTSRVPSVSSPSA